MARTPREAIAWCRAEAADESQSWYGLCLKFCRLAYAVGPRYYSAADAWAATKHRGSGEPPFGALLWWTGGSQGFGHVAISNGDGTAWTSDFGPNGYIGDGQIRRVARGVIRVSGGGYVGWSRDINGVLVVPVPAPAPPPPPTYPSYRVTHRNGSSGVFKPPAPGMSAFEGAWGRAREIITQDGEDYVSVERL